MADVNLRITGVDRWEADIARLAERADDLSPVWPEIGQWFAERQRKVFNTASFGRWAPLASRTILNRRDIGVASADPLIRTGSLFRTMTDASPLKTSPHFVVFGSQGGPGEDAGMHVRAGDHGPKRNPLPALLAREKREPLQMILKFLRGDNAGA